MAVYPWEEIFEKYKTGQYSMAELAAEYGFNQKYALRKAKKMGIEKGESRKKVEKEAQKKVLDSEVDKETKIREECEKIIINIRRATANNLFGDRPDFNRLKQLKIACEVVVLCRKEQYELNGIKEAPKQIEQKISGDISEILKNLSDEELMKAADEYGIDIE
ncbi:hypothetical protein [Halarsenatibacter silvermanii]|uniref:Uncharacterized protein n=1 Tax=Halarsenatibacter silvermanii TaxID=321763 RepID=A0A1G9RBK5_9FIRM|nr:hypothetical protein [Halarsenatibacter silvermanii]SDM20247.1 hypothetical protein SAMN04488692_12118 [Halarsenatibacter silvermanii]